MITADEITVRYGRSPALDRVSLAVADGAMTGLVGPNGSGKSSFLRALLGAVDRAGGKAFADGDELSVLSARQRALRLAAVAQSEDSGNPLTVAESVLLGRSVHRRGWEPYRAEDRAAAAEAMRATGVDGLADKAFTALSGGERQRALIARALAQRSTHLLLDEPTNHLDVRFQHEVLELVRGLPLCTVVVLHDLNLAARYCDEVVLLDRGRVTAAGKPDHVLTPPVLEPVYRIGVRRFTVDGAPHLAFSPRGVR
ncbi:ABC transporter ATP-binding protein [Salininema proteolyticum]|uniref:ABC transporter ATP-binding protein n=1 Tax=Salininema proteolyticum TaxID=1607685 RepID=A0ABV8TTV1_9ACTN